MWFAEGFVVKVGNPLEDTAFARLDCSVEDPVSRLEDDAFGIECLAEDIAVVADGITEGIAVALDCALVADIGVAADGLGEDVAVVFDSALVADVGVPADGLAEDVAVVFDSALVADFAMVGLLYVGPGCPSVLETSFIRRRSVISMSSCSRFSKIVAGIIPRARHVSAK
jgi:hypothetical protein